jgi:ABC-2 type transport system ATP-binding protein
MIKIENLGFGYRKDVPVLKNISMTLEDGKIYGLLGENGVGKTTLLTLLCGLKKVNTGVIDVDGQDPFKRLPSFLQNLYYLPDEVAEVNMTATDYAKVTGIFWPKFQMDKFLEIMKVFEVPEDHKMNKMSAGQLKKTYISFALACNTKYLFLDEPTNGLDIPSKTQFRSSIMKYTADDATIVISTHQVRDLENIIDPIVILDRQDVLLNASIEEISDKLFFDYGTELKQGDLYSEQLPGGFIQVYPNTTGQESKVNIEALFNAVHNHKDLVKGLFQNK